VELKDRKRVKVHTVYKTKAGARVPSVTTILGVLGEGKEALIHWSWKLGCQGIDYRTFRDSAASIGTLAHDMVLCHHRGLDVDKTEYNPADVEAAENCLLSYWAWERGHKLETILAEVPLVSQDLEFGGTVDWFGMMDGVPTLVDFKTGSGLYPAHMIQVAAYMYLLRENNYPVEQVKILRIGRTPDEGFEEKLIGDLERRWTIFNYCRYIYNLQKAVK